MENIHKKVSIKEAGKGVPKHPSELKWYTLDQVFKKASKTKAFQEGRSAELTRIRIAQKVRETRLAKRLTQGDVAKRASMPQSVIARLESGEHGVSVETLSRIASVLGKELQLV